MLSGHQVDEMGVKTSFIMNNTFAASLYMSENLPNLFCMSLDYHILVHGAPKLANERPGKV